MKMTGLSRGLLLAGLHVLIVASVGAKFLWDRANYPKVWVQTAPIDPDMPIRGRYVQLGALVALTPEPEKKSSQDPLMNDSFATHLEVRDKRLVAVRDPAGRHWVWNRNCGAQKCWQLTIPLAFFIPEHVVDPSRRPPGEELWVEVTVPPSGPPRPIRLGVKTGEQIKPI